MPPDCHNDAVDLPALSRGSASLAGHVRLGAAGESAPSASTAAHMAGRASVAVRASTHAPPSTAASISRIRSSMPRASGVRQSTLTCVIRTSDPHDVVSVSTLNRSPRSGSHGSRRPEPLPSVISSSRRKAPPSSGRTARRCRVQADAAMGKDLLKLPQGLGVCGQRLARSVADIAGERGGDPQTGWPATGLSGTPDELLADSVRTEDR